MSDETKQLNEKIRRLEKRLERVENFLVKMPKFQPFISEGKDELFDEAVETVRQFGRASASLLQRTLRIGYNRAVRILDEMSEEGIVSNEGGHKRELLESKDE